MNTTAHEEAKVSFRVSHIITQAARFNHLQQTLPIEITVEVRDILTNLPSGNPYDALKAAVFRSTSLSECQRFQHLLFAEELGDSTIAVPSRAAKPARRHVFCHGLQVTEATFVATASLVWADDPRDGFLPEWPLMLTR